MTLSTDHAIRRLIISAAAAAFIAASAPNAFARQDTGQPTDAAAAPAAAYRAEPYQRVTEDADGAVMRLEMAVRSFVPAGGEGPTLYLAGAIHIADAAFYQELQTFLDAQDIVLFEGVKPPGSGADPAPESPEEKIAATKRRIRFLAVAVERYKAEREAYPGDLTELIEGSGRRLGELVRSSLRDAWGNEFVYIRSAETPDARPFEIVSFGADGEPGGEGEAADLRFSDAKPLTRAERGQGGPGIQQKLADALGLEFQLKAMNHDRPNWRNSDLSIDEVQRRLEAAGADAGQLFAMLDGSSLSARFAGVILRLIGASPMLQATGKIALLEMLGRADELLRSGAGGTAALMSVLLDERNKVVIEDLRTILAGDESPETIAVIYGAGHLPDLERRLVEELGYEPAGDRWFSAIAIDLNAAGITPEQARQTRRMISTSLDRQLQRPQRSR